MRALVICILVAIAGTASAENLRDGCPSGRQVNYTKYGRFGAFASPDSLLQTNRTSLTSAGTYISRDASDDGTTQTFWTNRLDGVLRLGTNYLGTVSLATVRDVRSTADEPSTYGTLTLGVGYTRRFRTAIYAKPNATPDDLDSQDEQSALAGVRKGRGWTLNVSFARSDTARGPATIEMLPSAAVVDGESADYRVEGVGARFEYRTEIVGCWAPFLHVEFVPHWSRPLDSTSDDRLANVLLFPVSLGGGVQVSDKIAVFLQYRLLTIAGGLRDSDRVSMDVSHRFRMGVELAQYPRWRFNGFLDLAPQAGTGLGITATFVNDGDYR